jgi:hypothetical protein
MGWLRDEVATAHAFAHMKIRAPNVFEKISVTYKRRHEKKKVTSSHCQIAVKVVKSEEQA